MLVYVKVLHYLNDDGLLCAAVKVVESCNAAYGAGEIVTGHVDMYDYDGEVPIIVINGVWFLIQEDEME